MSRSYGVKKDFGLHKEGGVFLPGHDLHESGVASPSNSASSYRSTMPAYDDHQHKVHGKLTISGVDKGGMHPGSVGTGRYAENRTSGDTARTSYDAHESESPRKKEKKSRSWFGGKKNAKKTDYVIDGIMEEKSVARSSPMLQVRSAVRSGEKDQFGRPQTVPDERGDEEVRMHLSYDAPVNISKGKLAQLM